LDRKPMREYRLLTTIFDGEKNRLAFCTTFFESEKISLLRLDSSKLETIL